MVNNRLDYTLEPREVIIPEQQYGSRKNRPTTDVHIILEPSIQEVFRKKQHFIMVSLDLAEKMIDMHICRKRNHDHPDPQIRLDGQILEVRIEWVEKGLFSKSHPYL
jgi:hypothetical protein